jgi:hypothetical protein
MGYTLKSMDKLTAKVAYVKDPLHIVGYKAHFFGNLMDNLVVLSIRHPENPVLKLKKALFCSIGSFHTIAMTSKVD